MGLPDWRKLLDWRKLFDWQAWRARLNPWAKLSPVERKLFVRIFLGGMLLTSGVLVADAIGMLSNLERWLYDQRAKSCQYFTPPPSDQVFHLDIDDNSVEAIGHWPWPRSRMARLMEEIGRASPKAVAIDVLYSEQEMLQKADGTLEPSPGDRAFSEELAKVNGVVMPVSLMIAPPRSVSNVESAIMAELTNDLELDAGELNGRLRTRGFTPEQIGPHLEERLLKARRTAVYDRIRNDTATGPVELGELLPRLLKRTDLSMGTPMQRLVEDEYRRVMAVREMAKLGLPMPDNMRPPVQSTVKLVPLAEFTRASKAIAFVDFEIFNEPTIRSMPLLIEHDRVLYPQFGVALACQLLGADVRRMHVSSAEARIPRTDGGPDVVIPLRGYYSRRLGRDVPLIMDVPYFGDERWEEMYDWPDHGTPKQHLPLAKAWDICLTRDKIIRNNAAVDKGIEIILGDKEDRNLKIEPNLARKYADLKPDPEDTDTRAKWITITERESLFIKEQFETAIKNNQPLTELEKAQWLDLQDAQNTFRRAQDESAKLKKQLIDLREELAVIKDKAVLIGWTATGAADVVTTSIHPRCPGVVVHGVIANAVITGNWWRTAPTWIAPMFTIALGLLTAGAVGFHTPFKAAMAAAVLFFGYLLLNGVVIFDYGNHIVGAAGPLVAVATVWTGCGLMRLTHETLQRIRTARDLAVFRHEMELARSVQQALIPKEPPEIAGLQPHGWTKPADLTGGDCFDLWKLPDGRLGILLADASGHGLAPSMIVSQVRALVRVIAEIETHPDRVLDRVNARVAADVEAGRFATCFLGFLSADGELHWASAGHGPQLWCDVASGKITEFDSTGLPLGVTDTWVGDVAPPLQLQPTGMLIVFSDGIFEAPAPDGNMFGVERVTEIVNRLREAPAADIVAALREAVTKWQGKDVPHDDQTTVVVRRLEVTAVTSTDDGYRAVVAAHAENAGG